MLAQVYLLTLIDTTFNNVLVNVKINIKINKCFSLTN